MAEEQQYVDSSIVTTDIVSEYQVQPKKSFTSLYKYSLVLILLGFYFLIFAVAQLITNLYENKYSTSLACTDYECIGETDFINFDNDKKIYFYLNNPFIAQNDISSILEQKNDDLTTCSSYNINQEGQKQIGIESNNLNVSEKLYPCGMFVSYFPGESFKVVNQQNGQELSIQATNLDVLNISYQNSEPSKQWADVTSERFKIWNEKQISIGTNKFWGISSGFSSGSLKITLTSLNKINEKFSENFHVVVTDNNSNSGNNLPWSIFNFIFSLSMFVMGCIDCWYKQKRQSINQQDDGFQATAISLLRGNSPKNLQYNFNN